MAGESVREHAYLEQVPAYVAPAAIDDFAAVGALFRQAFAKHPVARLSDAIARDFFDAHLRTSHFFVARDASGQAIGFAIGGRIGELDECRRRFIRSHIRELLSASLGDRSFLRAMRSRMFSPLRRPPPPPSELQLRFIAVDATARRCGAGRALLEHFEAALPAHSSYHAWTLAGPSGAVPFYQACGFTRGCTIDGQVRMEKMLS